MDSNINPPRCLYLRSSDPPSVIAESFAEGAKQINELNSHIGELIQLRNSLYHRLHTPIYSLPFDILSLIFEIVVDQTGCVSRYPFSAFQTCMRQAFVLPSVSLHFRQVALKTPKLWRRVPLRARQEKMEANSALLRHCVPRVSSLGLHIAVRGISELPGDLYNSIVSILVASGAACKVEILDLGGLIGKSSHWVKSLSSFPKLDALTTFNDLGHVDRGNDFSNLSLTRIHVTGWQLDYLILPPSLQVLHLDYDPNPISQMRALYTCPNLVECSLAPPGCCILNSYQTLLFTNPLTLKNLKRLTWNMVFGLQTISSVQNLQMPSLEYLSLHSDSKRPTESPLAILLLCNNVSSTLTTLVLSTRTTLWKYDHLRQLIHLPFHKLETLGFSSCHFNQVLDLIYALNLEQQDHSTEKICLPNLRFLTLGCETTDKRQPLDNMRLAQSLLELLKRRTSSETSFFNLDLDVRDEYGHVGETWPTQVLREFKSIVKTGRLKFIM